MTATLEASRKAFQKIEPELNKTQHNVLKGLVEYTRTFRKYPRYKELAIFLNMDRITVSSRLCELRQKEFVMSFKNKSSRKLGTVSLITAKGYKKLMEIGL